MSGVHLLCNVADEVWIDVLLQGAELLGSADDPGKPGAARAGRETDDKATICRGVIRYRARGYPWIHRQARNLTGETSLIH